MAKRKKLIITREGYLVLAAIGVLLLAIIIIAVVTKGFGACAKEQEAESSPTPAASEYYPAPTGTPKATPEEEGYSNMETPPAETPGSTAGSTPAPTVPLTDDPNALTEPTAEMIAGAVEGKLTKSGVNMRQGPSTDTTLIATGLKSGTKLTVYAEDGEFYFVLVNETKKYGYISKKFVKLLSALGVAAAGKDQPEGTVRGTISGSTLALREGTAITSKAIEQYHEGQLVYIYYQEGDYYYVMIAGTELKGYLFAQLVKAEGTVPPKES